MNRAVCRGGAAGAWPGVSEGDAGALRAGPPSPGTPAHPHTPPLVLVAHGSRDPRAADTVARLVVRTRRARPGLDVRAAFLDHTLPHPR